jgi:hypothetical protein
MEYDCIKSFAKKGRIDELSDASFYLDYDIVIQIFKSSLEYLDMPK